MSTTEKGVVSDIARGVDWLVDGNNNWTRLRRMVNEQFGPRPAAFSGLTYAWFGGTGWNGSAWTSVSDGTTVLSDNQTNYVERTAAGVVTTNTSSFTASKIPMAVVTTVSGEITAISERRQEQVPATGVGITDGDKTDITVSASGATWTIDNNVVTFAKMQDIATDRLIGRETASSGDPEEIALGNSVVLLSTTLHALQWFTVAVSDETTALTTGDAKVTFRMPFAFTLTAVRASVTTAPTGAAITVDITEGGTTVFSTLLTIDATEKTSVTAATPAVISDSALADDAEMAINIDTVGSTIAGAGLKVTFYGRWV